jgi:hypothetical protein
VTLRHTRPPIWRRLDRRACPPEDGGGVCGHDRMPECLADPEHPAHEQTLEWAGHDDDPAHFDIEVVNAHLRSPGAGQRAAACVRVREPAGSPLIAARDHAAP